MLGVIRAVYDDKFCVDIEDTFNNDSRYGHFYLREDEFDLQSDFKKENNMNTNINTYNSNAYKGRFRIALIQFLDGSKYEVHYRIYDDGFEYKEGDLVVVKPAHHDMTIARIKFLYDDYNNILNHDENREVVCPIDISKYQERDKKAKEISKLRRKMDKKVKELQGVALYELMAQHSPELRDMLTQFKELTGVEASTDKLQDET